MSCSDIWLLSLHINPLTVKYLFSSTICAVLEIWGAEYQENNAFLTHNADTAASSDGPAGIDVIQRIAQRENCTVSVVGEVTGTF